MKDQPTQMKWPGIYDSWEIFSKDIFHLKSWYGMEIDTEATSF
jgi:hypothetical protein